MPVAHSKALVELAKRAGIPVTFIEEDSADHRLDSVVESGNLKDLVLQTYNEGLRHKEAHL